MRTTVQYDSPLTQQVSRSFFGYLISRSLNNRPHVGQTLRRHSLWLLALVTLGILATTTSFLFQPHRLPFPDFHPHCLGSVVAMDFKRKTEADFNRAFGCPGRLVRGNRTPGTPYTV